MEKRKKLTDLDVKKRISDFLSKHDTILSNYRSRLSGFYEMMMYNEVVRSYEELGFQAKPQGVKDGIFKYKLVSSGYVKNFSYFELSYKNNSFWIIHNLKVEAKGYKNSYITPDISIVIPDKIQRAVISRKKQDYIENSNLVTFFECKLMPPFPELLASFVGLTYCIKPNFLTQYKNTDYLKKGKHVNPSLLCAGNGSMHANIFKNEILEKHSVNICINLSYKTLRMMIKKSELKLFKN